MLARSTLTLRSPSRAAQPADPSQRDRSINGAFRRQQQLLHGWAARRSLGRSHRSPL